MRHRVQVTVVLFAWLLTTGSHWDVAQVVAWANMFSGYARQMTISAAVEKTFSGEMCSICRAVQKGKQGQEGNGATAPESKLRGKLLDVSPAPASARAFAPTAVPQVFRPAEIALTGRSRTPPPVPPPRA